MKKYVVRDYTMEQKGFKDDYTSEPFDSYIDALKEIKIRESYDSDLGIHDEYYIEEYYI